MNRASFCAVLVGAVAAAGCTDRQEDRANDVARDYLRAAANGDVERVCALRTDRALRWWGGRAGCERRAQGIAVGPVRHTVSAGTRLAIQRKALKVDARAARVLPADTAVDGKNARVVVDFGRALVEDDRAVGGQIIEIDLTLVGDDYRVARVGFAAHAD